MASGYMRGRTRCDKHVTVRIAIIGGGAAGLACAWLLEEHHEITLFEKDDRLGGHAHTVEIEAHGQRLRVDAGFQFFAPGGVYPTFNRLLDALAVERRSYPATLTLFRPDGARSLVMPPVRGGLLAWSSLTPTSIADLIRFRRFLAGIPAFLAKHDTTLTIAEYLERERMPRSFVDAVLLPIMQASGASSRRLSAASPPTTRCTTSARTCRAACARRCRARSSAERAHTSTRSSRRSGPPASGKEVRCWA
jgi:predicted NAD/FAD-binding protein